MHAAASILRPVKLEASKYQTSDNMMWAVATIQLLKYPIPSATRSSQKPSHGDISGTKRGIIGFAGIKMTSKKF